jgi:transcription antitermination factor NusG
MEGPEMNFDCTQPDVDFNWFALRVKSRCEKMVSSALGSKGFEKFLPLYHCRRRRCDRFKSLELPLFPGYIFCRLDPRFRLPILLTPGVLHFVGIGKTAVPIDDEEIAAIQRVVRSGLSAETWPYVAIGQRVGVEYGPLAGLEGFLVEIRKQQRVVVSVTLLSRSVAVEVERDWVRPLVASGSARFGNTPRLPLASITYNSAISAGVHA